MYLAIGAKELTAKQIKTAFEDGRAGIVRSDDVDGLVIMDEPIKFDTPYYRRGVAIIVEKPASVEAALEAAYF